MGIRRIRRFKFNIDNHGYRSAAVFFLSILNSQCCPWLVYVCIFQQYKELESDLEDLVVKTFELEEHLVSVHQMEMFYGEPTLQSLIHHTKLVVTDLEEYRQKYSLDDQPFFEEEEKEE